MTPRGRLPAYLAMVLTILILDLIWLGVIALPVYQRGIGHLMAQPFNIPAAIAFYLVYAVGLMVFALLPNTRSRGVGRALRTGALFGFFAYATYDLTNLATLRDWPLSLSLLDMAWGTVISGLATAAGKVILDRRNR
jgi:uncharacterized membrane protein